MSDISGLESNYILSPFFKPTPIISQLFLNGKETTEVSKFRSKIVATFYKIIFGVNILEDPIPENRDLIVQFFGGEIQENFEKTIRQGIEFIEEERRDLEERIQQLEDQAEETSKSYIELTGESIKEQRELKEELQKVKLERDKLKEDKELLIKQKENLTKAKEGEEETLAKEKESLQKELDSKEEALKDLKNKLERCDKDIESLKKAKGELEEEIKKYQEGKEKREKKINEKEDEIKKKTIEIDKKKKEIEKLQKDVDVLKKDKKTSDKTIKDQKSQIDKCKRDINSLQKEIETYKEQLEKIKKEKGESGTSSKVDTKRVDDLKKEKSELEEIINNLEKDKENLEFKFNGLTEENKKLNEKIDELNKRIKELEDEKEQQQKEFKEKLEKKNKELQSKASEIKQINSEKQRKDEELQEKKSTIETKNEQIEELNSNIQKLESEKRGKETDLDAIKLEVDSLKRKSERLESEKEGLKDENKTLEESNELLEQEIEDYQEKQSTMEEIYTSLVKDRSELKDRISQTLSNLEKLEIKIDALDEELKRNQKNYNTAYKDKINNIKNEIVPLKKDLSKETLESTKKEKEQIKEIEEIERELRSIPSSVPKRPSETKSPMKRESSKSIPLFNVDSEFKSFGEYLAYILGEDDFSIYNYDLDNVNNMSQFYKDIAQIKLSKKTNADKVLDDGYFRSVIVPSHRALRTKNPTKQDEVYFISVYEKKKSPKRVDQSGLVATIYFSKSSIYPKNKNSSRAPIDVDRINKFSYGLSEKKLDSPVRVKNLIITKTATVAAQSLYFLEDSPECIIFLRSKFDAMFEVENLGKLNLKQLCAIACKNWSIKRFSSEAPGLQIVMTEKSYSFQAEYTDQKFGPSAIDKPKPKIMGLLNEFEEYNYINCFPLYIVSYKERSDQNYKSYFPLKRFWYVPQEYMIKGQPMGQYPFLILPFVRGKLEL